MAADPDVADARAAPDPVARRPDPAMTRRRDAFETRRRRGNAHLHDDFARSRWRYVGGTAQGQTETCDYSKLANERGHGNLLIFLCRPPDAVGERT